ncbi:nuclear transport factor 2 family protein [Chryseolinea sp. T2]|uniref:nuclear transport factor 2 family protein n=1 Tax=Chryseolinea sp. T2 TaxID=3129255 RepID=UPI003076FB94
MFFTVASSQNQSKSNEEIIRAYFEGFVNKDWSQVAAQLDKDFTFTSPAPDDHINATQFKDKCWPQSQHIRKFEYVKIVDLADEAIAIMHVVTSEGKILRNVEYFHFKNRKILSIEVFFGGTGAGYPTNAK